MGFNKKSKKWVYNIHNISRSVMSAAARDETERERGAQQAEIVITLSVSVGGSIVYILSRRGAGHPVTTGYFAKLARVAGAKHRRGLLSLSHSPILSGTRSCSSCFCRIYARTQSDERERAARSLPQQQIYFHAPAKTEDTPPRRVMN